MKIVLKYITYLYFTWAFTLCSMASAKTIRIELEAHAFLISVFIDKNGNKIEKPDFRYHPLNDLIRSLQKAGFSVVQGKKTCDIVLEFVYYESEHSVSSYKLTDNSGNILLKERLQFGYTVKDYISNYLGSIIGQRLKYEDEVSFIISQIKVRDMTSYPITPNDVFTEMNHLLRLYELNDSRSKDVLQRCLRSYDPRQRWVAKFALLNIGYSPKDTIGKLIFEMVNTTSMASTVAYNFLHSGELLSKYGSDIKHIMLNMIITKYGEKAIKLILDDIKCQTLLPHFGTWYGGGDIREIHADLVISNLKNNELIRSAVSNIEEALTAEHKELTPDKKKEFLNLLSTMLSQLKGKLGE